LDEVDESATGSLNLWSGKCGAPPRAPLLSATVPAVRGVSHGQLAVACASRQDSDVEPQDVVLEVLFDIKRDVREALLLLRGGEDDEEDES
jgi:hypothetical protein